jgi:hypothetical protein
MKLRLLKTVVESVRLPESAEPAAGGIVQFGDGACFRFTLASDCTVTLHADSRRHAQSGTLVVRVSSPAREAALRRHLMGRGGNGWTLAGQLSRSAGMT